MTINTHASPNRPGSAPARALAWSAFLACAALSSALPQTPADKPSGADKPPAALPRKEDPAKPGQLQVQTTGESKGLQTPVTLDADDAYLPKVLAALAERSGYNVVAGPEVNNQQRISIHLRETPIEEAINLVVRAAGLSYEIVGNSFLVSGHENLKKEVGLTPYLIELEYARASEVKLLFKDLSSQVQVDTARNALLISTSPKTIAEIRNIVKTVDKPSKQLMLQTRVIEVSIEEVEKLGVDWEKLSQITTIVAENAFDPALGGVTPTEAILGNTPLGQLPEKQVFQKIDGLKNVGHFSRQLSAFNITVDWLLRHNLAKVLNDTKLTTLNNRPAEIFVGDVIPFLVQSQQTAQVEREEIGIKVQITPQINNDGYITANVRPEVSTVFELIDGRIPRKKIRTASTTVLVRNRQKIYIAGLMSDDISTRTHKLPFFGDLLFVGGWFRHKEETVKKTDLVIEITPFILNNADDVDALMADSLFKTRRLDSAEVSRDSAIAKDRDHRGPTHLVSMPSPGVLKPYQYVIGVQEISLGQHNNLQVTYSPWMAVGRLLLGVKYSPAPSVALGVGWNRGSYPDEGKYDLGDRLGVYLSKGFLDSWILDWFGTLDMQLGSYNSFGGGTGFKLKLWTGVALLAEAGESYTPVTPEHRRYWDPAASAALRVNWPWLRGLSLDGGAVMRSRQWLSNPAGPANPDLPLRDNLKPFSPMVYFDLAYSGVF
ncbi:MAG TPA: secretin and TonB N-terminal domain-containing protein [Fibrobacteria bacterium]|nr:secretin and TonB N-terminal domain-containing protein [Fibrobacteria bacterium]